MSNKQRDLDLAAAEEYSYKFICCNGLEFPKNSKTHNEHIASFLAGVSYRDQAELTTTERILKSWGEQFEELKKQNEILTLQLAMCKRQRNRLSKIAFNDEEIFLSDNADNDRALEALTKTTLAEGEK